MTTIMQPFQCDLQPQIQETHRTARRNNHSLQNTEKEPKQGTKYPSRNRRTQEVPFIAGRSHLTQKNKVSCSGLLPKTKPMQHSCSHSNAICNQRFKKRIELRTQEQPLVAKHREGTRTTPAATAAHRRYLSSPAAAV